MIVIQFIVFSKDREAMEMTIPIPCVFGGVSHPSMEESFVENKHHFSKTYQQFVQFSKYLFALNRLKDFVLSI